MNLTDFYRRVLPAQGRYCLFGPRRQHIWYDTIDELVAGTEKYTINEAGWYFGTNGFDGSGSRKQENVIAARSLRLDLDCGAEKVEKHGPDKVYDDQRTALAHIVEFIKWSGIKPTMLVDSGGGWHIYYSFEEDFATMALWRNCAEKLKHLCRGFGLKIDPSVTLDEARVLRPVGALHKNGRYVSAKALRTTDITLGEFAAAYKLRAADLPVEAAAPARKATGINADIFDAPRTNTLSSAVKASAKCIWIKNSLDAQGNVDYDNWINMLSLLKVSTEGEDFAVEWSNGHPEADEDVTRTKLDSLTGGAPTCSRISDNNPACHSCAQWGKIKTPYRLGMLNDQETAKLAAPAPSAPKAEADEDGLSAMMGGVDEVDEPSAASAGGVEVGMESKREDAFASAKEADKRKALIDAGLVPFEWPSVGELEPFCGENPFFLANSKGGRLLLCCFHITKTKVEGGTLTQYKPLVLTEQPFHLHSFVSGSANGAQVILKYINQYDSNKVPHWAHVEVEAKELFDPAGFRDRMASIGVSYHDAANGKVIIQMMQRYAQANLALLRQRANSDHFQHRMGFQFVRNKPVYVQGAYRVDPNGDIKPCILGGVLRPLQPGYELPFLPSDELAAFRTDVFEEKILPMAKQYAAGISAVYNKPEDRNTDPYAFGWFIGVASPYMAFVTTEVPTPKMDMPGMGFALSLYSTGSGYGKSALQRCIMRAYGDADFNKMGGDRGSGGSAIAIGVNLASRGSLPYFIDETSNNTPDQVSELIHKISIGKDKVRATRTGAMAEHTGSWCSIANMSANVSQRMLLTEHRAHSEAEQMRVLEIDFEKVDKSLLDKETFDANYASVISPATGALGLLLGRYAVMNWGDMRNRADHIRTDITKQFGLQQNERYFTAIYAAACLTADVMAEYGIVTVSRELMDTLFKEMIEDVRSYVASTMPTNIDYAELLIRDMMPRLLRTATETDRRGGTGEYDHVSNPDIVNRSKLAGRYVASTHRLYVMASEFAAWATKRGVNPRNLLRQLQLQEIALTEHGELSAQRLVTTGIHPNTVPPMRARVHIFNVGHLSTLFDQEEMPDNVVEFGRATKSSASAAAPEQTDTGTGE